MAVSAPSPYYSGNWQKFASEAIAYHEATRPNDNLVAHKIETVRKYLSPDATWQLGGFVRAAHPRFNTTEGWNEWLEGTSEVLGDRKRFCLFYRGHAPSSVEDALADFKAGKTSIYVLWWSLDELVEAGRLSSSEQREAFWTALDEKDRVRYASRCAAFDPANAVWEKGSSNEVRRAEQALSAAAELSYADELIPSARKFTTGAASAGVVAALVQLYVFFHFVQPHLSNSWRGWLGVGLNVAFGAFIITATSKDFVKNRGALKRLQDRQRNFHERVSA